MREAVVTPPTCLLSFLPLPPSPVCCPSAFSLIPYLAPRPALWWHAVVPCLPLKILTCLLHCHPPDPPAIRLPTKAPRPELRLLPAFHTCPPPP